MTDATPPHRRRHLVRTALVRVFGRPCRKQYVLWSLAVALEVGIIFGLWLLVPIVPKATMHAGYQPWVHAFSSDGRTLVTCGNADSLHKGPIRLWDVETGLQRLAIVGNWPVVRDVKVSPNGKMLMVEGQRGDLTMWETATGKEVVPFSEFLKEADWPASAGAEFSPDGRFLILQASRKARQDLEFFLVFWDVDTRALRASIDGDLSDLVIAKDGKQMALIRRRGSGQFRVEQWQLDTGFPESGPARGFDLVADDVAISPKFDVFASFIDSKDPDKGNTFQLWDLATGKEKAAYTKSGQTGRYLRFSDNGRFLEHHAQLYDTTDELKATGPKLDRFYIDQFSKSVRKK